MKVINVILAVFLAVCGIGATNAIKQPLLSLSDLYKGKIYTTILTEKDFETIPKWNLQFPPPLQPAEAEKSARSQAASLVSDDLLVTNIRLAQTLDQRKFCYVVEFIAANSVIDAALPLENHARLRIAVLLDGTAVAPSVEAWDGNKKIFPR